jgi:hypothetical protein
VLRKRSENFSGGRWLYDLLTRTGFAVLNFL